MVGVFNAGSATSVRRHRFVMRGGGLAWEHSFPLGEGSFPLGLGLGSWG